MCLAVPGRILDIDGSDPILRSGTVDFAGIRKTVNLACVPEAQVGDYVLVHVGFAIETVDEAEANQVFDYLRQMGDLAELEATASTNETEPPGNVAKMPRNEMQSPADRAQSLHAPAEDRPPRT
jgi:hydrogenase expression/formation protein HypC